LFLTFSETVFSPSKKVEKGGTSFRKLSLREGSEETQEASGSHAWEDLGRLTMVEVENSLFLNGRLIK
jgi:hypothetical protein